MINTIRCSGVPEHFNLPWKLMIEEGRLKEEGIDLDWIDNPSGTGSLCQELKEGNIDIAILLLEGAIKNIHEGLPAKIVSTYVESPLIWGVHTGVNSSLTKENLLDPSFAISRPTSGSHLMAHVYARDNNVTITENSFDIINDLNGAIKSLKQNDNQLFLWEKYTTKPLVDTGVFNRIDVCPTPWPAFVVVVQKDFLEKNKELVNHITSKVLEQAQVIKNKTDASELIASRYGLKQEDAQQWLTEIQWAETVHNDIKSIELASDTLLELGVIEEKPIASNLIVDEITLSL
ncbi:ABC transporter substrate-binding protein [Putridiphycobacter roseus]|uniref:ABC transporter substrate-binding protein n=1 Tax=Putridiphycobacter roseus TaxID=2219161 RepID=A0A2W1MV18_9FLAO|nr:ABC transporter substrate-binding protein [Putridiphycobacter roseus]PZE15657.1 ABC transporter substrate-binding protein [Putridiphycobacter roseus]